MPPTAEKQCNDGSSQIAMDDGSTKSKAFTSFHSFPTTVESIHDRRTMQLYSKLGVGHASASGHRSSANLITLSGVMVVLTLSLLGVIVLVDAECFCEKGKYCLDSGTCVQCDKGQYQNEIGKSFCIKCPRGKYGISEESINETTGCIDCDAGRYSDVEAVSTTNISDSTFCSPCALGKWNDQKGLSKEAECFNCNLGRYSTTVASSSKTNCVGCKNGTYLEIVGAKQQSDCLKCPAGFVQKKSGAPYCLPCAPGTHQDEVGQSMCKECNAGLFRGSNDEVCQNCPSGWLSGLSKAVACTKCSKGMYGNLVGQIECENCPINYFSYSVGQNSCKRCNSGLYTLNKGQTSCQRCGAGKYGDDEGCHECPRGWYRTDKLGIDLTKCLQCDKGETSDRGAKSCQSCSIGQYGVTPGKCTVCLFGQYQNEKKQTGCLTCADGREPNDQKTGKFTLGTRFFYSYLTLTLSIVSYVFMTYNLLSFPSLILASLLSFSFVFLLRPTRCFAYSRWHRL